MSFKESYDKIRKIWVINPKTRVKPKKQKYNRSKTKQELKRDIYD